MLFINSNDFRGMAASGAKLLEVNRPLVDSLNVFPVPDGDTGTNMSLTLSSAIKELGNLNSDADMAACTVAFSKGALKGARGNSGVITSQILKGFAVAAAEAKGEFSATDFTNALIKGTEIAYSAVTKPKEGTILTVIKSMAEKAASLTKRRSNPDFLEFLNSVIEYGDEILLKTPDMLPVLKKAGVVDAGGKGLMYVMRGMYNALAGIEIPDSPVDDKDIALSPVDVFNADDHEHINFSYCTEFFIINLRAKATLSDIDKLRDFLMTIGDCVLVIGDLELVKVHVHTNRPDLAMKNALKLGELDSIKVENMVEQNRILNEKREAAKIELKNMGMLSICAGKGMEAIFKDLGVDKIVEGGQTMNPSVYDILSAINEINAKEIFVFPNNKNIILAAEQASGLSEKPVHVIPTSNVAEGIAAAVCYMPESSVEENMQNMNEAIARVKCGQTTTAVRNTRMDGFSVHEGDVIGLFGKKIVAKGNAVNDVVKTSLKKMVDDDSAVISLYYGEDITKEAADSLAAELTDVYPDLDIMAYDGGQPYYYYIFSVE